MVRRFRATTGSATTTCVDAARVAAGSCSMVAVLMVFPPVIRSLTTRYGTTSELASEDADHSRCDVVPCCRDGLSGPGLRARRSASRAA